MLGKEYRSTRLAKEVLKIREKEVLTGAFEFIDYGKSNKFNFAGDPETPRYKILKALNQYCVLGYSDLARKSGVGIENLKFHLKRLIKERVVIKWNFVYGYTFYSHCFVPWFEVEDYYKKKYSMLSASVRNDRKRRLMKKFEKILKI